MPRRNDIKKIMLIGSGPIVIGQACEFDYSGTQGVRALRAEGFEVVLVNSNPATIMTDPELAERTYVEPITIEVCEKIIAKERPDALLPTMGGQTALNTSLALEQMGVLQLTLHDLRGQLPVVIGCDAGAIQDHHLDGGGSRHTAPQGQQGREKPPHVISPDRWR